MQLTQKQQETLRFIDTGAQASTIKSRSDRWVENTLSNLKHYSKGNPPILGLTAFIVAAGPSLAKNYAALGNLGRLGVLIAVDASFRFLVSRGIVPDYCMSIDSDGRMQSMIEGTNTSNTILVTMASSSPSLIDAWQGPKFFVRAMGGSQDLDEKLTAANRLVYATRDIKAGEQLNPLVDVNVKFPGLALHLATGGNVTTAAHSFAHGVLRASKIAFVGADYSWEDKENFYAGGEHREMGKERVHYEHAFEHSSKGSGLPLMTNFSMFHFKKWHEDLAAAHGDSCLNCTEGGILGIGKDGELLPGWEFIALEEAIKKYTRLARQGCQA